MNTLEDAKNAFRENHERRMRDLDKIMKDIDDLIADTDSSMNTIKDNSAELDKIGKELDDILNSL